MSKFIDGIIGLAIGDAMGVPTEFLTRNELLANPVTKMVGGNMPAGTWSDDTSMTIALVDSITRRKIIDYSDIMHNFYLWINEAKFTATEETFDVGRTCLQAIINYSKGFSPVTCGLKNINSNGNGSLMRILPIAYFAYYKKLSNEETVNLCNNISSLTHAHEISRLACYIYVRFAMNLISGMSKKEAYEYMQKDNYSEYTEESINVYSRLIKNNIKDLKLKDIKSTGYVVDTLESAIWILMNSRNYADCIITSTNIGGDTDTIGAVVGGLAGILYGYKSIPVFWLNKLIKREYLIELATKFEETINK